MCYVLGMVSWGLHLYLSPSKQIAVAVDLIEYSNDKTMF